MSAAQSFWLGALDVQYRDDGSGDAAFPPLLAALAPAAGSRGTLLVDVIRTQDSSGAHFVVLLAATADATQIDQPDGGVDGRCLFGFTDRADWCDGLCGRGFTLVTSRIVFDESSGSLSVFDPLDPDPSSEPLLHLDGIDFTVRTDPSDIRINYAQQLFSPELGRSDVDLLAIAMPLATKRRFVARPTGGSVKASPSARINLTPLGATQRFGRVVNGQIEPALAAVLPAVLPARRDRAAPAYERLPRPAALLATGYRFEDVELFGFRIDLGRFGLRADKLLETMIEPLNFHLHDTVETRTGGSFRGQDFIFRPATRAVVIELLRYGKMYWGAAPRGRPPEPFTFQHELLLRVLVGRVDDDGAQARDPALYVPAIFVDNPWSKLIGREFQGFDKRLVSFETIGGAPLTMAGQDPATGDRRQVPLSRVAAVRPVDQVGAQSRHDALVTFSYPPELEESEAWLQDASDTDWSLGSAPTSSRFRQRDFEQEEFRRSFAREVFESGFQRFSSIQVAPIDARHLPGAWITGQFTLSKARVAYPAGVARLRLGCPEFGTPDAWSALGRLFEGEEIALPTGEWYRARCNIDMRIEDGLV